MNGISDGVAVVTGAAGGIGRAAAERFAEESAWVVATDVDGDGLEVTVEEIESTGGKATAVETDVTDKGSVRALVEETEETYGVHDMAFNNAGIEGDNAPLAEQSIEDWTERSPSTRPASSSVSGKNSRRWPTTAAAGSSTRPRSLDWPPPSVLVCERDASRLVNAVNGGILSLLLGKR